MVYDEEYLEEIKNNVNLLEYIGNDIELKKKGKDYFGHCPKHVDLTPSFSVNTEKNIFYCFSCGAQGDSIDFVSQYFGIGLKDAAEKLLNDFGIGVMPEGNRKQGERVAKDETPFARYRDKATEITQVIRKLLGHRWQMLEWKES